MAFLGALGLCPFVCSDKRVLTPHSLSKKVSARIAEHAVIGQKPTLEYVGPSADTVSMNIRLDAGLGVPPSTALPLLERMVESGSPFPLVIGTDYFGQFVIESVDEERRYHTGAGVCRVAEVKIELKEAGSGGISGLLSLFA